MMRKNSSYELADMVPRVKEIVAIEESMKQAPGIPFINVLGYDAYDLREVFPDCVRYELHLAKILSDFKVIYSRYGSAKITESCDIMRGILTRRIGMHRMLASPLSPTMDGLAISVIIAPRCSLTIDAY